MRLPSDLIFLRRLVRDNFICFFLGRVFRSSRSTVRMFTCCSAVHAIASLLFIEIWFLINFGEQMISWKRSIFAAISFPIIPSIEIPPSRITNSYLTGSVTLTSGELKQTVATSARNGLPPGVIIRTCLPRVISSPSMKLRFRKDRVAPLSRSNVTLFELIVPVRMYGL